MSYKVEARSLGVNVTAVIRKLVTKAPCKSRSMQVLLASSYWSTAARHDRARHSERSRLSRGATCPERSRRESRAYQERARTPSEAPTPRTAIIKNCAHDDETTDPLHHRYLRPPQRQSGSGRRRPGHAGRVRHQALRAARFAGCTTTRFSPDSPAPPPMLSRFSAASKPSWSSITAIWAAPPSNSPKTGAPTSCCATWKPCSWSADKDQTFLLSGQGDVIEPDGRHCRHRQRRPLCPGRGSGAAGPYGPLRPPDRGRSHEDRRQDVHLYQRQVTIEEL